jgi:hypothetical protein
MEFFPGATIEQDCRLMANALNSECGEKRRKALLDEQVAIAGKERAYRTGINELKATVVQLVDADGPEFAEDVEWERH